MLGWVVESSIGARAVGPWGRALLFAGAIAVGASTIVLGPESAANLAVLAGGAALCFLLGTTAHKLRQLRA